MFQLCKHSPYFFIAFGSTHQRIHNKVTSLPRPHNDGRRNTLFRLLFHDLLSVDDVETLGQATAVVNLSAVEGVDALRSGAGLVFRERRDAGGHVVDGYKLEVGGDDQSVNAVGALVGGHGCVSNAPYDREPAT